MRFRYRALGLDIVAPFACAGFWPVERAVTGREIAVDLGPVPARLDSPACDRPLLQINAEGTALHHVPGVARYLMRERSNVTIALEPGTSLDRAVDFLKGTPLLLLCHQWGLIPLAAACLAIEGRALVLGASAGSGKSSLALALATHGFRLMGDGLCALEATGGATPVIWPAFPEVKAWRDSLEALGLAPPGDPGPGGRYTLAAQNWFEPEARPALAIAALHSARGGIAERASRRRGGAAFELMMNMQTLADAARGLRGANSMNAVARLGCVTSVYEVWHPNGLDRLADLPGWLIERLDLPAGVTSQRNAAACA